MIIVPIKEGESIDKALKKLKKKFDKIGVKKEIRARQEFTNSPKRASSDGSNCARPSTSSSFAPLKTSNRRFCQSRETGTHPCFFLSPP